MEGLVHLLLHHVLIVTTLLSLRTRYTYMNNRGRYALLVP
jgi:hypothetical protein